MIFVVVTDLHVGPCEQVRFRGLLSFTFRKVSLAARAYDLPVCLGARSRSKGESGLGRNVIHEGTPELVTAVWCEGLHLPGPLREVWWVPQDCSSRIEGPHYSWAKCSWAERPS